MLILLKKGRLEDLETWKQVKAEDRLQVYNAYLDYIRSHLVLNGFDSFYQEPTTPKVETKIDWNPLIVFLSLKICYRVRDAYAIKLYGQDEGMSFDVAGQRLFGSNIAIKMVCYMAPVLEIWPLMLIFRGRRPTF